MSASPATPAMAAEATTSSDSDITTTEDRNGHLLRLPAELRNRIYELVWPIHETEDLIDSVLTDWRIPPPSKALLLTCRQMYQEARLIFQGMWFRPKFQHKPEQLGYAVDFVRDMDSWRLERVTRFRIEDEHEILDEQSKHKLVLGVEKASSVLHDGVWSCSGPPLLAVPPVKLVLLPKGKLADAMEAAYPCGKSIGTWYYVEVSAMSSEEIAELKRVVGRKILRREELVTMIRETEGSMVSQDTSERESLAGSIGENDEMGT